MNGTFVASVNLIAIGILGALYANVVSVLVWQVSMVMTTFFYALNGTILAAPQQSPSPHVFSPLAGLKVPFERDFSHLQPAAPFAGFALASRSATMFLMASFLADTASDIVFM